MKTQQWYRARIRWAEMVEGRGIRNWEEGLYLFRSHDREAAFGRALESRRGRAERRGRRNWPWYTLGGDPIGGGGDAGLSGR
jgi:hypothetical protein